MNSKIRSEAVDHLLDGILTLKTREECYRFFEDVCTINEILALAQRFEVASMLRAGSSYVDVSRATGASSTTVSRVSKCLNGAEGGYRLVFERMESES